MEERDQPAYQTEEEEDMTNEYGHYEEENEEDNEETQFPVLEQCQPAINQPQLGSPAMIQGKITELERTVRLLWQMACEKETSASNETDLQANLEDLTSQHEILGENVVRFVTKMDRMCKDINRKFKKKEKEHKKQGKLKTT